MFMSTRKCKYIHTAVELLTMRVEKPYKEYWVKLKRVLKYIKVTRELKITLSVGDMSIVKWWVDSSYAVHEA